MKNLKVFAVLFATGFLSVSCNLSDLAALQKSGSSLQKADLAEEQGEAPAAEVPVDEASVDEVSDSAPISAQSPVRPLATPRPSPVAPVAVPLPVDSPYAQMSDQELFDLLVKQGIGQCYIFDARVACPNCFCEYYFKSNLVPWAGKGWPVNPASRDSTGCISSNQWGGYSASMATRDLIHNGAEQARDALRSPSNPCGVDQVPADPKSKVCPLSFAGHPLELSSEKDGVLECTYEGGINPKGCEASGGEVANDYLNESLRCEKRVEGGSVLLLMPIIQLF